MRELRFLEILAVQTFGKTWIDYFNAWKDNDTFGI